jgi:hypothetical protein
MKTLCLSKEEFNKLPPQTILQCSGNGDDLYSILFSDFKLSSEELKAGLFIMKEKGVSFTEEDEKGNFSNLFILDYLWEDDTKTANNTETVVFHEGEMKVVFVDEERVKND